jgi:hypothetical protein
VNALRSEMERSVAAQRCATSDDLPTAVTWTCAPAARAAASLAPTACTAASSAPPGASLRASALSARRSRCTDDMPARLTLPLQYHGRTAQPSAWRARVRPAGQQQQRLDRRGRQQQ